MIQVDGCRTVVDTVRFAAEFEREEVGAALVYFRAVGPSSPHPFVWPYLLGRTA